MADGVGCGRDRRADIPSTLHQHSTGRLRGRPIALRNDSEKRLVFMGFRRYRCSGQKREKRRGRQTHNPLVGGLTPPGPTSFPAAESTFSIWFLGLRGIGYGIWGARSGAFWARSRGLRPVPRASCWHWLVSISAPGVECPLLCRGCNFIAKRDGPSPPPREPRSSPRLPNSEARGKPRTIPGV